MKLLLGDCLYKLKELEDNSVDSIVTDPPYGLSFMGKDWDKKKATQETKSQVFKGLGAGMKMTTLADNIEFEKWVTEWASECMRVLKPGGYMLAFGGSRMYHRLASGVENAGFEIRDQMMWVYGSGFPKSMNIGIQVDKKLGNEREVVGEKVRGDVEKAKENGSGYLADPANRNNTKQFGYGTQTITKGNTEWEGWGTALKPAHEPIVMARKPLSEKTVVDNVLEWGTGGINIDESRISTDEIITNHSRSSDAAISKGKYGDSKEQKTHQTEGQILGRFPANIIFDEEAGKLLDEQSGVSKSTKRKTGQDYNKVSNNINLGGGNKNSEYNDEGGASRFFYCPKTSKTDRNEGLEGFEVKQASSMPGRRNAEDMSDSKIDNDVTNRFVTQKQNIHPTVKPTDLMLYLIRLVTPKGGTTLDPFMGSGSTGKGAVRGGFNFIGIEMEEEYFEIAKARIQYEKDNPYNEERGERIETNKNANKFF